MINQRASGKAAERRVAKDFNAQRMGIMGKDDVRVFNAGGRSGISFEVKTRKALPRSIKKWYNQAVANKYKNNIPILVLKEKSTEWKDALVIMSYGQFMTYMIHFYKEKKQ